MELQQKPLGHPKLSFTVREVCQLLSISRSSLFRAIKRGDLTKIKIGKRTLITQVALDAFLAGLATVGARRG